MSAEKRQEASADLAGILDELDSKYKNPTPESISLQARKFENVLSRFVVPFVGINALILGGLTLYELVDSGRWLLPVCSAVIGGCMLYLVWKHNGLRSDDYSQYVSAAAVLMLFSFLEVPLLGDILALAATAGFVAAVLRRRLPEKSVILFAVYFPVLLSYLRADNAERMLLETLVFLPMFLLLMRNGMRTAAVMTVIGGAITGWIELYRQGGGVVALSLMLSAFVIAGIVYEWRLPRQSLSDFRRFVGQGLLMAMIYFLIQSVAGISLGANAVVWLWAVAASAYQALQLRRENMIYPTRIAWIAIAFLCAVWQPFGAWTGEAASLPGVLQIAISLALVSMLQLAAMRARSGFLSAVAVILMLPPAMQSLSGVVYESKIYGLAAGVFVAVALFLLSRRERYQSGLPWWRGFIRDDHVEWFKRVLLVFAGAIMRVPLLSALSSWFRAGWNWLKYFKGEQQPFGFNDAIFVAANLYSVLFLERYLRLFDFAGLEYILLAALVWALWGLWLLLWGVRRQTVYYRLLGICFMLGPVLRQEIRSGVDPQLSFAAVGVITGLAFWITGMAVRWRTRHARDPDSPSTRISE